MNSRIGVMQGTVIVGVVSRNEKFCMEMEQLGALEWKEEHV